MNSHSIILHSLQVLVHNVQHIMWRALHGLGYLGAVYRQLSVCKFCYREKNIIQEDHLKNTKEILMFQQMT